MAGSQSNFWGQHVLNSVCFGLSADAELQQRPMDKEFNSNASLPPSAYYPSTYCSAPDNIVRAQEGDQVVPTSQRRPASSGHQRQVKPLPPLPDPEELMSDEAADNEVEFFTSDRQRLLPKSCPRAVVGGKVNHAYQEGLLSMAFSWPGREDRGTGRGAGFGAAAWAQREEHPPPGDAEPPCGPHQRSRLCFPSASQPHDVAGCPSDKPQVPPRIPITPKPPALSLSTNEEDVPPKIPPRVPLVPPCPPSSPTPKSLPIYINGVMPATQSFAANPKYVSRASHYNQQRERAASAHQASPCIVPIVKDGRQASATHYILLPPGRTAYADRRERLFSEPSRTGTSSVWQST
ncbi:ERBB receptor feedback inhibitor 1 [Betta splendens]|uniref:ERBB receptor feedback inhibitor 1 n=1 Tax=Betta splendens TaxID=158456 RepID=A0A6P7N1H5_BETSP|nr:ERBB receptor feedback inhibitor 1 [Betta splendens]XP_029012306.1 ERBB receptor feedback inhibitor 1 [Betta splendens]